MRHKTKSVLAVFLSLAVLFTGCRKMYDQVMEGIEVSYNVSSFLTHQVVVQLVNANSTSTVKPIPAIAIEGQDADKVFDINGGSTIAINNGMAQLVVSPGQSLNGDAVFTIRASAPGFLDYEKQVVITSKDTISNYILPMIERANPPNGVKVEGLDFEVPSATATTTTSFIQLPLDQNVEFPQRASLTIATGTKFYDNRVRAITGTITTTFTHYNTTDEVTATENPFNSKSFTNVLMKGTVAANDVIYSPLAILDIKMMGSGSKEVFSLSTGMTARLEIASNTYNLVTKTAFAQNNQMEVYAMAVGTTTWQYLTTTSFSTLTSGRLTASLLLTKPGRYIFLPKITPAASKLNVTFVRETKVNTSHFILVTDQNNRKIFSYDQVEVFNGKVWTMPDRLPNAATNIRVFEYDFAGGLKGRQVAQYAITAGATSFTSSVNPQFQLAPALANTNNVVMKFDLTGSCSGSTLVQQRYDGKILYKLNAADRYMSLGQSTAGYMEVDRLLFGTNYFFNTTVSAPHVKTKKIITTTYERQRQVWRDPKTGTGQGAPGGIDIDYEVIGYFRFESTKTGTNGTNWDYWTFVKRSAVNGVAQNWIIPATACATYGY